MTNDLNSREGKLSDPKEIVDFIRKELKAKHADCKFSVTKELNTLGGLSITVSLMTAPFDVFADEARHDYGYAELNKRAFEHTFAEKNGISNGVSLTVEAWGLLTSIFEIANSQNWDQSRPIEDYYSYNYRLELHVGKHDKKFEVFD